ncbi:hypothetical protein [Candidatus Enterococcus willemsii]|uniref:Gram-positive cocci surface proteins LPxTG domain-containing protein n=1 Tax=Candidatus Enterococcus willemsii TaxID=1857215 RepID=A0ABQ6YW88_9ENTE|nr:hypothetical protein [Enterococcus sp. CU12B]KAF1301957.1 hypothetical protein BAU17_00895 [Enterococcus sp. CU12B]
MKKKVQLFFCFAVLASFIFTVNSQAEVTTGKVEFYYEDTLSTREPEKEEWKEPELEAEPKDFAKKFNEIGKFGEEINILLSVVGIGLVLLASYYMIKIRRIRK